MLKNLKEYLRDPFLNHLYREIRQAGSLRSISVDLTHLCNLRCQGCYYYSEKMDQFKTAADNVNFDAFIAMEKTRGTNFMTIVGGEPSLELNRLKKLYDNFSINVATNGLRKIPYNSFPGMPIGISVWGASNMDKKLRGSGKINVFAKGLQNYRNDPRAFWYYTVAPGNAREIEEVVNQCIGNGNYVLFNFYGDIDKLGGQMDFRQGFDKVRQEINRMIDRYPDRILMTSYLNTVVTTGKLYQEKWGYDVCTNISCDNQVNTDRIQNGNSYNAHFRAYNADFKTTRRCCTGITRNCVSCFDTWEHFSWVMLNLKKHLGSRQEFTNWLTTMYMFYLINRIVDFDKGIKLLPEIHDRLLPLSY